MSQSNVYMEDDNLRLYVDVQPLLIDELVESKNAAVDSAESANQSAQEARSLLAGITSFKTNLELFYAQASNGLANLYNEFIALLTDFKNSVISDFNTQSNRIIGN